jgi:hypothetical protein
MLTGSGGCEDCVDYLELEISTVWGREEMMGTSDL